MSTVTRLPSFVAQLKSGSMPKPVDPEAVNAFVASSAALVSNALTSHAESTQTMIAKAVKAGSDVRVSFSPMTREVAVTLHHQSGKSNTLFATRHDAGDDK